MFDNQGGYNLSLGFGLTNAAPGSANGPSAAQHRELHDLGSVQLAEGIAQLPFGGDYTRLDDWANNYNNVPSISMGFTTNFDPADAIFTAVNFPGSTAGDRNNAKALYALLTGRVSAINATGRLNSGGR